MKFESLTRDGIGYEYDKGYEVYVRHNPIADENLYEFQTYNDGMVQHSNRYAVPLVDTLNVVDGMAREGWAAINNEMQAYETIIFKGGDVIKALRTLAMRLDRAALIKLN